MSLKEGSAIGVILGILKRKPEIVGQLVIIGLFLFYMNLKDNLAAKAAADEASRSDLVAEQRIATCHEAQDRGIEAQNRGIESQDRSTEATNRITEALILHNEKSDRVIQEVSGLSDGIDSLTIEVTGATDAIEDLRSEFNDFIDEYTMNRRLAQINNANSNANLNQNYDTNH